jgi:hypothetical protein
MVELDKIAPRRISSRRGMFQAMSRCHRQRENLIGPEPAPACDSNLYDRGQPENREQ